MISYLVGTIQDRYGDSVTVLTGAGVGYEVRVGAATLQHCNTGQKVQLYIYTKMTDSAMSLYGFQTKDEKEFFSLLLTVSGVGPKSAMNILGIGSLDETRGAIVRGDVKYLTAVQGMGKKTAERLVVELKNKLTSGGATSAGIGKSGNQLSEVVDGLVAMGYGKGQAQEVVQELDVSGGATTEVLMKQALRFLSR